MAEDLHLGKSDIVCANLLNQIVEKGRQTIKKQRTIKKFLVPHTTKITQTLKTEMMNQPEYQYQFHYNETAKMESMPQSIQKDEYSSKSLSKIFKKGQKEKLMKKSSIKDKKANHHHTKSYLYSPKKTQHSSYSEKMIQRLKHKVEYESKLMKLPEEKKERILSQKQKFEFEEIEDTYRQNIIIKEQKLMNEREQSEKKRQEEKERSEASLIKFNKEKRNPDNCFTFDIDGKWISYSKSAQKKVLKKQFPAHLNFSIEKQIEEQKILKENQKVKAARGQAFSSCVLKTVNISRISVNSSLKEQSEENLMERNDMFNNNYARQTTSIPFLKAKPGTVYTEPHGGSVKNESTDYEYKNNSSASRIRFKKFFKTTTSEDVNPQANFFKRRTDRITKTAEAHRSNRISTGFTKRPKTGRTTGHITTINQSLAATLIQ